VEEEAGAKIGEEPPQQDFKSVEEFKEQFEEKEGLTKQQFTLITEKDVTQKASHPEGILLLPQQ